MTKITKLDKAALKALREPIEAELKALGERLGLKFDVGNGSFGDGAEASFKLLIKVDNPEVEAAAAKAQWDRNCRHIGIDYNDMENSGLRPEDFGTEFTSGTTRYRTTGINIGRAKYPIAAEVVSGPKAGQKVGFTDMAVPVIRKATDAKVAA
jgi:hypothetical protein